MVLSGDQNASSNVGKRIPIDTPLDVAW